mmetsp:Transcript_11854/g.27927  ORF Transcript_11854/g.27927 Transcript_11854/m.27927 type:complete len:90 (+) Transcript_11854:148-417(+)
MVDLDLGDGAVVLEEDDVSRTSLGVTSFSTNLGDFSLNRSSFAIRKSSIAMLMRSLLSREEIKDEFLAGVCSENIIRSSSETEPHSYFV